MRDHFDGRGLQAYLDTPGGQVQVMQHGSRARAAQALAEAEAADRAWRLQRAAERFERNPGRYESPSHAMADIADPAGGFGAVLDGAESDMVRASRLADPAKPWHSVQTAPDATVRGISQAPGGGLHAADTRPPWQREG